MTSGLRLYANSFVVGSLPNPSGNANIESIKANVGSGMANYSKAYVPVGKLMGAGLVLKQAKKLSKIKI